MSMSIRAFAKRYALILYFVLTYGLSWAVWGSRIAFERGLISWHLSDTFAFLSVTFAAVAMTALTGGRAGLGTFFSRLVRWRVPLGWYGVTLGLSAGLSLVAIAFHLLLGGEHQVGVLVPLKFAPLLLVTQLITHLLTEEAGWRGFALPRLQTRFNALVSSLILGTLWAFWHLPLFFMLDSHQSYPFAGFFVMAVAVTVIMTWLYNHTDGSVLLAALFHAGMNTSLAVLNVLWGDLRVFWLYTALLAVAAVIITVGGPHHLARHDSFGKGLKRLRKREVLWVVPRK